MGGWRPPPPKMAAGMVTGALNTTPASPTYIDQDEVSALPARLGPRARAKKKQRQQHGRPVCRRSLVSESTGAGPTRAGANAGEPQECDGAAPRSLTDPRGNPG